MAGTFPTHHLPETEEAGHTRNLEVVVLFTTERATEQAMETASKLAHGLNARLRLLAPQVVPFPLDLDKPAVRTTWITARLRDFASHAHQQVTVDIRLCRDADEAIGRAIRPGETVVLGAPRRWWPTSEQRTAARLRAAGHHVLLIETN
jgi:hypothetical protein